MIQNPVEAYRQDGDANCKHELHQEIGRDLHRNDEDEKRIERRTCRYEISPGFDIGEIAEDTCACYASPGKRTRIGNYPGIFEEKQQLQFPRKRLRGLR